MNDFQNFLDETLSQINVDRLEKDAEEVYEYDIHREIQELVINTRADA